MPRVSVIIPCYNEEKTIHLLLEALDAQTYPRAEMETIIADGMSTDSTRQRLARFQEAHPGLALRVVDNPARSIPAALNRAIAAAQGEIIVRLDAHSAPRPDYVARCVQALDEGLGDNVGGVWEIRPGGQGWQARAIAVAAAHPLGVGDARYRYSERAQAVDTVPFGAFRRELVERIGPFDESLLTNEDYEFNVRLRQAGGIVWLEPNIRSTYFARPTLGDLARQYWRYGYWKARMLRRYPDTIRWRQALPPVFVLSLLLSGFCSLWLPVAGWLFVIESSSYSLVLLLLGVQRGLKERDAALMIGVPLAIACMHLAWGSAFLWSVIFR
ncbi:MAG: glycosyltransferase family 2 protein [Anaerolineales bacterium]|nr:glycosyltransferase family 2 protein [Anaerolineales bacterium]